MKHFKFSSPYCRDSSPFQKLQHCRHSDTATHRLVYKAHLWGLLPFQTLIFHLQDSSKVFATPLSTLNHTWRPSSWWIHAHFKKTHCQMWEEVYHGPPHKRQAEPSLPRLVFFEPSSTRAHDRAKPARLEHNTHAQLRQSFWLGLELELEFRLGFQCWAWALSWTYLRAQHYLKKINEKNKLIRIINSKKILKIELNSSRARAQQARLCSSPSSSQAKSCPNSWPTLIY